MKVNYDDVQEYYGKRLSTNEDLQTNACCPNVAPPKYIRDTLKLIHEDVKNKYYGCGLTIPYELEGRHILDLGSGSGRDCFIAAKLVGEEGSITGVDMTDEQLNVAQKYIDYHTEQFNYRTSNTRFLKGNIDNLDSLDLKKESIDIIISNCVINLSMNKPKLFKDAFSLLKNGGEMYFSDVYADRRIPESLQKDPVLWGECLSGALYWNDFLNIAKLAGFTDPRVVTSSPITVENEELQEKLGDIQFFSVTYRLFKLDGLESDCEDYGQSARYKGTIKHNPAFFDLDDHHRFPKGKMITVCGNTYKMLQETRFAEHFEFFGDWDTHYGIFEGCGGNIPYKGEQNSEGAACC